MKPFDHQRCKPGSSRAGFRDHRKSPSPTSTGWKDVQAEVESGFPRSCCLGHLEQIFVSTSLRMVLLSRFALHCFVHFPNTRLCNYRRNARALAPREAMFLRVPIQDPSSGRYTWRRLNVESYTTIRTGRPVLPHRAFVVLQGNGSTHWMTT